MANKFDRIIQENFEALTLSLINRIIDVEQPEVVRLPRKIQRTLEREMDNLLKVKMASGNFALVNMEWQAKNDPKMNFRMLLYHAISSVVYDLPVFGIVVYIGRDKLNMPATIISDNLSYNYRIIDLTELSPEVFLKSNIPEEVIMAVLAGKTRHEEKRKIINQILFKLRLILGHDKNELNRRIGQLEVLGELRDVQKIIIQEEQKMAITYNLEKDLRYNQGLQKRVAETKKAVVLSLLRHTDLSIAKIAKLTNCSPELVRDIKKGHFD